MRMPMLAIRAAGALSAIGLVSACRVDHQPQPAKDPLERDAMDRRTADAAVSDGTPPLIDVRQEPDVGAPRDTGLENGPRDASAFDASEPPDIQLRCLTIGVDGNALDYSGPFYARSFFPRFSGDGDVLAFRSGASNLVQNDNNNRMDVFLWHHRIGEVQRVSIGFDGREANNSSNNTVSNTLSLNHDGTVVVFESVADNLVDIQLRGLVNLYARNLNQNTTELINVAQDGSGGNNLTGTDFTDITADGRHVVFSSRASNLVPDEIERGGKYIFVRDRLNGTTQVLKFRNNDVLQAIQGSHPAMTNDGRFVAFQTGDLLVESDNNRGDIYILDRQNQTVELVSVVPNNQEPSDYLHPAIDNSGHYIVFWATNNGLVDDPVDIQEAIFLRDRVRGETRMITVSDEPFYIDDQPRISGNGRLIAFATNDFIRLEDSKVFVYDRLTGRTAFITPGFVPDINEEGDIIALTDEDGNICIAEIGVLFE
jgi:Tol biopolymer transport system component